MSTLPKLLAFYLPQYHPVPENDAWWGKGFTEWTNVTKCTPRFPGHYQPHLPADLGFYDLRLPEARVAQANLAKEYGIHGFCYYHYWFGGKRILERPFNEVLHSGDPDFPFCLCWANENWTRRWDGQDDEVLLQQNYSEQDDLKHIRELLPAFIDQRYIRINGKPIFLVYRATKLPNPLRTMEIWRDEAKRHGIADLALGMVQGFPTEHVDPSSLGFDFAVEFAPDWTRMFPRIDPRPTKRVIDRIITGPRKPYPDAVVRYENLKENMLAKELPDYKRYRCVAPSWDNSARRKSGAAILSDSTPKLYGEWLQRLAEQAMDGGLEFVFINAWNEWAEGNHLEPCQRWGRSLLEETRRVTESLNDFVPGRPRP